MLAAPFSLCARTRIPASTWEYRCGLGAHLKDACFALGGFALRAKLLRYARAQGLIASQVPAGHSPAFVPKAPALLSGVNALSAPAGFGNLKGTRFCALRARSRGWALVSPRASLFRLQKRSVLAQGSRCFSPCARSAFCAPLPCSPLRPYPASAPAAGAFAKNCAFACFGSVGVFPAPAAFFRRAKALSGARALLVLRWQKVFFSPYPPALSRAGKGAQGSLCFCALSQKWYSKKHILDFLATPRYNH